MTARMSVYIRDIYGIMSSLAVVGDLFDDDDFNDSVT